MFIFQRLFIFQPFIRFETFSTKLIWINIDYFDWIIDLKVGLKVCDDIRLVLKSTINSICSFLLCLWADGRHEESHIYVVDVEERERERKKEEYKKKEEKCWWHCFIAGVLTRSNGVVDVARPAEYKTATLHVNLIGFFFALFARLASGCILSGNQFESVAPFDAIKSLSFYHFLPFYNV